MQIGELADRVGLSLRTLRHWEEAGLVSPSGRTEGGFRLYSEADAARVLIIRSLKPCDFSLDELKRLMSLYDSTLDQSLDAGSRADAGQRLAEILGDADRRLRLQRERVIAAELALTALRAATPYESP